MRRVAAKFVPKLLNCDQKQHRMNIANEMLDSVRDDPNLLQRVITGDEAGVVHHEFLPQGRTVNKEYYLQVMRNLREAIRQKRPDLWKNKNWLLHHDNAPAHTSLLVRDFLAKNNTLMMPQPPYCPDLAPSYGDAVMSRIRVFEWYKRFKEGREEIADNERSGRPSTSTTPEKVYKVLELNARKETAILNLEATTDDPELLKRVITGDETWIYGFDSETIQQASEWRFKNKPRPKKARKAPSKVKVMLTVFSDYQGIVHHEFQQQGSTITADSYLGGLRRLREAIRQKRPEL
ncbi:hypothetical protein LAZ67_8000529 [Cordylochernes scorpioides]|uniref:Transposase n=1 Tax=Cordylochernes scorpioides TaxID=51811 RepID=A0ABY6KQ22_9ARAC|nr:hypothetical protein LAZ67_8000529 [Cordylochernes scorpioides]